MTEDGTQFLDAENFQGHAQELSFRGIVLQHVERIIKLGSTEWRAGVYITVPTGPTTWTKMYIPSTSESYRNAVDQLYYLLTPYFDDHIKKLMGELAREDRELTAWCKKRATELKCPERWMDVYKENYITVSEEKFRIMCIALHQLGYLDAGVFHEEAE